MNNKNVLLAVFFVGIFLVGTISCMETCSKLDVKIVVPAILLNKDLARIGGKYKCNSCKSKHSLFVSKDLKTKKFTEKKLTNFIDSVGDNNIHKAQNDCDKNYRAALKFLKEKLEEFLKTQSGEKGLENKQDLEKKS